jgi:hypothetical protein
MRVFIRPVLRRQNGQSDHRQGLPNDATGFIAFVSEFSDCATDLRLTHSPYRNHGCDDKLLRPTLCRRAASLFPGDCSSSSYG